MRYGTMKSISREVYGWKKMSHWQTEPGTTVYIATNCNDQHSGWSADDQYSRKYNDPVRLESWNYQGKLIYPADAAGRGAIVDSIGSNVKIENNSISI
jgi:hypothetical protein